MNTSSTSPTRILFVDDHEMFLQGVEAIFSTQTDKYIVTTARRAAEARTVLAESAALAFDLVLLDVNMPEVGGIEFCQELRRNYPTLRIIALSMHREPYFIRSMIQAGANGYVVKSAGKQELTEAIHAVLSGASYISPSAAMSLITDNGDTTNNRDNHHNQDNQDAKPHHPQSPTLFTKLSEREREIVQLLVAGLSSKEIANSLFISPSTVETHRKSILRKTGAHNTADLVQKAMRNGLA
jgi:DNA-binding NarL/FixJ family response regulator